MGDPGYVDVRTAEVREYDGLPGMPGVGLAAITRFSLFEQREVDLDELPQAATEAALGGGVGGYELQDTRRHSEFGAGGAAQEVVLHLVATVGDAAVAASVAAAVDRLIAWAREKREGGEAEARDAGGSSGPSEIEDLEPVVSGARLTVCRAFGAEEADLNVDEAELLPGGARVEISDTSRGRIYVIAVSEGGLVTRVREARR